MFALIQARDLPCGGFIIFVVRTMSCTNLVQFLISYSGGGLFCNVRNRKLYKKATKTIHPGSLKIDQNRNSIALCNKN